MSKKRAVLRMVNEMYIELIDNADRVDEIVSGIISNDRGWIHFEQKNVWVNRGQIVAIEVGEWQST
jgi:hypothetical protein